jgi:hypothetical protein
VFFITTGEEDALDKRLSEKSARVTPKGIFSAGLLSVISGE